MIVIMIRFLIDYTIDNEGDDGDMTKLMLAGSIQESPRRREGLTT